MGLVEIIAIILIVMWLGGFALNIGGGIYPPVTRHSGSCILIAVY
jgi:hypothetical protein